MDAYGQMYACLALFDALSGSNGSACLLLCAVGMRFAIFQAVRGNQLVAEIQSVSGVAAAFPSLFFVNRML